MEKISKEMYLEIFKEREYRKLMLSTVINRFGDSVDAIAFTWLVYQLTHSAAWSAIVFAVNTLPNVLVQPFAGAIVEKMNKKTVIVSTHLMRALIITGFMLMYHFGMVTAALMAIFTLVITTVESFNLPASSAFTVRVVKKEHMTCGMSISSMLSNAASLVGTGAGGVILAAWGVVPAMLIDVATFLIAAVLIFMMKYKENDEKELGDSEALKENENAAAAGNQENSFLTLFKDGIAYVARTPIVRNFCILCVVLNFMLIPINALQAPIAGEIFGVGSELLSFVGIFASIGGILGAAILPFLANRLTPLKMTALGIMGLGLGMTGIANGGLVYGNRAGAYAVASICFLVMMVSGSLVGGVLNIQFMKSVDKEYMARASAVFNATATAAMPIGSLLVSVLVAHIPTNKILMGSVCLATLVLLAIVITRPVLGKEEEQPDAA